MGLREDRTCCRHGNYFVSCELEPPRFQLAGPGAEVRPQRPVKVAQVRKLKVGLNGLRPPSAGAIPNLRSSGNRKPAEKDAPWTTPSPVRKWADPRGGQRPWSRAKRSAAVPWLPRTQTAPPA